MALAQFLFAMFFMVVYLLIFSSIARNSANMATTTTGTSASFEAEGGAAVLLILVGFIYFAVGVALVIPTLALTWRRLHDAGFPGPFYFLGLIPIIGGILVLVFVLFPTRPEQHNPIWNDPAND